MSKLLARSRPLARPARRLALVGSVGVALGLGGLASAPDRRELAGQSASPIGPYTGVSRPSDVRELAFGIRGRVAECMVEPGDEVKAGQAIVRMDDAVQRHTTELARLQARDETSLNAAIESARFREYDLGQLRASLASGGSNEREIKDGEYQATMARAEVEAARQELAQSAIVLAREEARLAEMTILAPVDGTVVDVHRRAGEAVDESTNVVTIIRVDPMWMDVNVSMSDALRLRRGQSARVVLEDVEGVEPLTGRLIFISPAGHAGARQVMVRLEIPNPGAFPTGMHATVEFLEPDAGASRAGGADPRPGGSEG